MTVKSFVGRDCKGSSSDKSCILTRHALRGTESGISWWKMIKDGRREPHEVLTDDLVMPLTPYPWPLAVAAGGDPFRVGILCWRPSRDTKVGLWGGRNLRGRGRLVQAGLQDTRLHIRRRWSLRGYRAGHRFPRESYSNTLGLYEYCTGCTVGATVIPFVRSSEQLFPSPVE